MGLFTCQARTICFAATGTTGMAAVPTVSADPGGLISGGRLDKADSAVNRGPK